MPPWRSDLATKADREGWTSLTHILSETSHFFLLMPQQKESAVQPKIAVHVLFLEQILNVYILDVRFCEVRWSPNNSCQRCLVLGTSITLTALQSNCSVMGWSLKLSGPLTLVATWRFSSYSDKLFSPERKFQQRGSRRSTPDLNNWKFMTVTMRVFSLLWNNRSLNGQAVVLHMPTMMILFTEKNRVL